MTAPIAQIELISRKKSESEVMTEIEELLKMDSRIAWAVRVNSGGGKGANGTFFRACRVIAQAGVKAKDMRAVDIFIMLTNGRAGLIEVKNSEWKFNPKDRKEVMQKAAIDSCVYHGGVAGFARSVEDVSRLLDGAF